MTAPMPLFFETQYGGAAPPPFGLGLLPDGGFALRPGEQVLWHSQGQMSHVYVPLNEEPQLLYRLPALAQLAVTPERLAYACPNYGQAGLGGHQALAGQVPLECISMIMQVALDPPQPDTPSEFIFAFLHELSVHMLHVAVAGPLSHLHDLGSWIAGVTAQRHLIVTGEKALQTGVAHAEETIQELTVMARTPQP